VGAKREKARSAPGSSDGAGEVTSDERDALNDIRGTYKESLHYVLERLLVRLDALESKVAYLQSKLVDVDARTLVYRSLAPQTLGNQVSDLDRGPSGEE